MNENPIMMEMLLPSGLAVRFVDLDVSMYLDIQEAASTAAGADFAQGKFVRAQQIETLLTCLRAYTVGADGKAAPVTLERNESDQVDIDKTLDTIPASAWKTPTRLELMTKGPGNLLSVLRSPADFLGLYRVIQERSGPGASPLPAKTRVLCSSG